MYSPGVLGHVLKQVIPPLPYSTIPNFPHAAIPGHEGQLLVGTLEDIPLVVFQGRAHAYQGFSLADVCKLKIKTYSESLLFRQHSLLGY